MTPTKTQLSYLFSVVFDDNSEFTQTGDDVDSQNPKKSAFSEYLRLASQKKPIAFALCGIDGDTWVVDMITGIIYHNADQVEGPENPLKEEDHLRIIYSRDVEQTRVVPAIFHNPQGYKALKTGQLMIRDHAGNDHVFPTTSRMQHERTEKEQLYYVYPVSDSTTTHYNLGWQATVNGKNIQKVVRI